MRARWKRIRYRLEWLGLLVATKLIPLCSRQACHYLACTVGALLSVVDRRRYDVALSNLEVALATRSRPSSAEQLSESHFNISRGP